MASVTVPPDFFKAPPDPEVAALEACLRALLPLDPGARGRVLEYLDDRLITNPDPRDEMAQRAESTP